MTNERSRSRNPAGHAGLLENLLALVSALAEFFEGRFALFAQESKSAALHVLILVACLILAVVLCMMGYVFIIVAAVVALAHLVGASWPVVAFAAAILHFVIALVLLLVARSRITKPVFPTTIDELKKDREWLKHLDATNQSTS